MNQNCDSVLLQSDSIWLRLDCISIAGMLFVFQIALSVQVIAKAWNKPDFANVIIWLVDCKGLIQRAEMFL